MAEDTTHSCSYCDSQHTQLDFALHKISNAHLKKVQRALFQRGFSSVCLVCNSALKDLKHLELHVQERRHIERMMLMKSFLCSDKCTCGSCGVTFFNEVVLEAHCLLRLHDLEASPPNTPKLNELCKQLSGLCGTRFLSNGCHPCSVCNVTLDGIQESIMHLFTPAHITRLRSSSCMVCKKDFMHASDRESHLKSTKHSLAMRKCSNFLEEGDTQSLLRKGGYPCMFCMIWCNSWLCLGIHILDTHHNKVLAQRKANYPFLSKIIFVAGAEGAEAAPSCNESVMSNWKEWREEALEERIWCHRCGVTLLGIDEANQHLNTHGIESCRARREMHSINALGLVQLPKIYECSVCAMSFKSSFMLSAHTSCLEHHRRLAAFSSSNIIYCCSSCGLLVKSDRDSESVSVCKNLKGSLPPLKGSEAISRCLKLPSSGCHVVGDVRSSGITSISSGAHQSQALVTDNENVIDENAVHLHRAEVNGLLEADESNQGLSKANLLDAGLVRGPKVKQTMLTIGNSSDHYVSSESRGFGRSKNLGCMSAKAVVDGNSRLVGQIGKNVSVDGNNNEPNKDSLHSGDLVVDGGVNTPKVQDHTPLEVTGLDDSILRQNKVLVPDQMSHEKGTILVKDLCLGDLGVPVIVAATLAPLKNLQESLQSITAIVTETLSSALSNFCVQQSTSSLKRKSQGDIDDTNDHTHSKRLCEERSLEAALQQGLRSVSSNATKLENENHRLPRCVEEDMVRHSSTGDAKEEYQPRAVLAVAASVIPSCQPDLSRPANEQDQVVATKAQESSAMPIDDTTSKEARESADLRGESLSQGVRCNQGTVEKTIPDKAIEERQAQAETVHLQPGAALACPDTVIDEGSLQVCKPVAPPLKAASHNSKSESNEDDDDDDDEDENEEDDYSFLDPAKSQGKWWGLSDSDDSDSL